MLAALVLAAQASVLVNGGFDRGLDGWTWVGYVGGPGEGALRVGPGKGAVRQRYDVPGLRVLFFGAKLRTDAAANLRLQCFDARRRLLLEETASADPKKESGIYLKTQARTAYVVLSIEKPAGGLLEADDARLTDDGDPVKHASEVDLGQAMRPFWSGDTVSDETVLLSRGCGGLLFTPSRIVSVKAAGRTYVEGKDFVVEGKTLTPLPGSSIPTMAPSEFAKGEFPWTSVAEKHLRVTYEHRDRWAGPIPAYEGESMPRTMGRLTARKRLTVVALGDSITLGMGSSGLRDVPPFLPAWPTLFVDRLKARYRTKVNLYNVALGGMTADWGMRSAPKAVAALDPDLVIVAFGMNDFWAYNPAQFRANVEETLRVIRARRPQVEFLLVAPILFDPAYTADPTYVGNLTEYAEALRSLAEVGVRVFDMTALSRALYDAKSPKDLLADPMHPDDFLARIYAQGLFAMLDQP